LTRPDLPRLALLPVRFFFGLTFLWAGLDKLLDPSFLDPTAAGSLHAQLATFARSSPLGGLVEASLPYSTEIGVVIAIAEIGAGLGALTGLAFRVAALGGLALSGLFWLTASWAVHPYYYGADLPYAFGWLALAIAGHGDLLVVRGLMRQSPAPAPRRSGTSTAASPERRLVLQTASLAALAAVVASLTLPLRSLGVLVEGSGHSPGPSPQPSPSGGPSAVPSATIPPDAVRVARVADVSQRGSVDFTIPFDAPAPLPAGDPGVIVKLADGSFVAFDAVCTHAGCTVEWDPADRVLVCPCHDAVFDAEHQAAVLDGPAPSALSPLPIVIDAASGSIFLVPAS
jgi:thiosulfate dehydrogenase [quinone] large subunit